jgi:allophanate hydrolase
MDFQTLGRAYQQGRLRPEDVAEAILERAERWSGANIWITPPAQMLVLSEARNVAERFRGASSLPPLYGLPFAIKDNIDLAGFDTTAGCPAFAYRPTSDAIAVERLRAAGAFPVGKTNLDQFATGLVGVRSPYGAVHNAFDPRFIAGGSSAGSAVAVAAGLASFSLGTDTAGSGRVPAALNNVVGLKPTRGSISNRGTVPACRSLDCVSIFALNCVDAQRVLDQVAAQDPADPFSRRVAPTGVWNPDCFRFGVPNASELDFAGDQENERLFEAAVRGLEALGGEAIPVSIAAMLEAAELLYEGPWLAERVAALGPFWETHADAIHPVVREIIAGGEPFSATDAFRAAYRLLALQGDARKEVWNRVDLLVTPTTPTTHTIEEVHAAPVALNTRLGRYTNFVNLMDLCAVAVPAGFRADGQPLGVSLIAPAGSDAALSATGARLHVALVDRCGTAAGRPPPAGPSLMKAPPGTVDVAVVGAHLEGQPLHGQLRACGARLQQRTRTTAGYRLYALQASQPPKPALVRDAGGPGGFEVEVYRMTDAGFGAFVALVPAPLGIGTVDIADGRSVKGFICEQHGLAQAPEISSYGGWRAYLAATDRDRKTSDEVTVS